MRQFIFEADKTQHEKPTEPKYVFCQPAIVKVCAETEAEAQKLAEQLLKERFAGTGFLLARPRLVETRDLALDWSYGYGDEKGSGTAEDQAALRAACTK